MGAKPAKFTAKNEVICTDVLALVAGSGELYVKLDHPTCGMSHTWMTPIAAHEFAKFILANVPN